MSGGSGDRIRVAHRPGEIEIAVLRNGALADHALWRPGQPDGFHDLHRGRVRARAGQLGGCFVALEGGPDGFLPDRETNPPPGEGTLLGVRVIRAALGGKGPRLSARLDPASAALAVDGPARRIARGPSPLAELQARHPDLETCAVDPHLAAFCGARLTPDRHADDDAAADALAALRGNVLDLPGGARATIHPTPALVAIDVDTAGATERGAVRPTALFAANRAILPDLLHAVRLRNLSGAIVIDLAGLPARKRQALAPALEAALARDPLAPRLLGFSALGFAEIVRVRQRPPLHELLASPHGTAIAAAADFLARARAAPATRCRLALPLAAAAAFEADAFLQSDLLRETGRHPIIRSAPDLPSRGSSPVAWRIEEIAP